MPWKPEAFAREKPVQKSRGKPPPDLCRVFTKKEVAEHLKVSERTIERWVRCKKLRKMKGTRKVLFPEFELQRFIAASLQG